MLTALVVCQATKYKFAIFFTPIWMIISRVKAGCFMVSGSIAVFGLAAILADDSLPETKAAALTPFQNLLVVASVVLIIVGVYFMLSSKTCPVCGEKVIRSAVECRYCGTTFKIARQR